MEKRSGKNKRIDENKRISEDTNCEVKDRTFYGNVFHRNICWQRSYQRPEGEDMIMALYGSLRNGLYNYRRFDLQNKSEFLGMTKVKGYALYSLGPYPGIYPSEESFVVAEVRRFSGKEQLEVAKSIDYMELFGGYHREYVDLEIGNRKIRGFIYVYDEKPETEKIKHGDWVYYLSEKEENIKTVDEI